MYEQLYLYAHGQASVNVDRFLPPRDYSMWYPAKSGLGVQGLLPGSNTPVGALAEGVQK